MEKIPNGEKPFIPGKDEIVPFIYKWAFTSVKPT